MKTNKEYNFRVGDYASIGIDAPNGFCTQKYIKKISKTY